MIKNSISDAEFWDRLNDSISLNNNPNLPLPESSDIIQISHDGTPSIKHPPKNLWDFDRQKMLTERIQFAGLQKAKEEEIRVKNLTKQELFPVIKETIYMFQKDISIMNNESYKLKEYLVDTHYILENIQENLELQCKAGSKMDFYSNLIKPIKKPKKIKLSGIKEEIQHLQEQIGCLKALASEYQRDAELAEHKVTKLQSEINSLNSVHSEKIKRLNKAYLEKETDIKDETKRTKAKFLRFRENAELELLAREIIKKRQNDFIVKLHNELGNSKFIIQNPRLRTQFHKKVQKSEIKEEDVQSGRNEIQSRLTKYSEAPDSYSLSQTRPVTNDLRPVKKIEEDDPFALRIKTRIKNSISPFT